MSSNLTADILSELKTQCSFDEVFKDCDPPMSGQILTYPRKKIGHIRADHNGYRWHNTVWPHKDYLATKEMKREVDETYQALIGINALSDFEALRNFCCQHPEACVGNDQTEYNFYYEGKLCYYWLRLITRYKDYNLYLSFYTKNSQEDSRRQYFSYLEKLRDSGETNMYGAAPYLERKFPELDKKRAEEILIAWISSFEEGKCE